MPPSAADRVVVPAATPRWPTGCGTSDDEESSESPKCRRGSTSAALTARARGSTITRMWWLRLACLMTMCAPACTRDPVDVPSKNTILRECPMGAERAQVREGDPCAAPSDQCCFPARWDATDPITWRCIDKAWAAVCDQRVCGSSHCRRGESLCLHFVDCDPPPVDLASTCGMDTECNGTCIDTKRDTSNCGACGKVCQPPANMLPTCSVGHCSGICAPGFADCDNDVANGCEISIATDPNNCGGCGERRACQPQQTCVDGRCQ